MREAFADNDRFRFFDRNEIGVADFLGACHIYALTYHHGFQVPGPRSLMEAMAAGCAPVVIDRNGPRDRVVHGESGFRSNDEEAFIGHVVELARDCDLREVRSWYDMKRPLIKDELGQLLGRPAPSPPVVGYFENLARCARRRAINQKLYAGPRD